MNVAIKKGGVAGLVLLFMIAGWGGSRCCFHPVEIRGVLSQTDLAEICRFHRAFCPSPALCPGWLPVSVRSRVSAALNPIEIIAVPKPSRATVVYRGFDNYYYDRKGRHRGEWVTYTLDKDASGWHYVFIHP